jgi:magnesium transporter
MKVLTVFSIILMTASLVAGIYGMNVPLPGQGIRGSFWILMGSMAVFAAALLVFFRKRRWI